MTSNGSSAATTPPPQRGMVWKLASNLFFIFASLFYLLASYWGITNVKGGIEDENDEIEVEEQRGLLFMGAFCFVIVGIVDWCKPQDKKSWLHIALILAGIFGCISAVVTKRMTKHVFDWFSTHFYLLESVHLIHKHYIVRNQGGKFERCWTFTADFFFFLGAFMDVVMSYTAFFNPSDVVWNLTRKRGELSSSVFWLAAALITTLVSCCCSGADTATMASPSTDLGAEQPVGKEHDLKLEESAAEMT